MNSRQLFLPAIAFAFLACDKSSPRESARSSGKGFAEGVAAPASRMEVSGRATVNEISAQPRDAAVAQSDGATSTAIQASQTESAMPPMMIRTGYATVEVQKLDPAIAKVRALAAKVGGYITNTSTSGGRDQVRSAMLEVRMPAPRYDETISGLSDIGRVETAQTSAQDVGEEFVDVSARADNARKLETRLVALLAQRTGKLEEVLAVERELARVRTEIDQLDGRIRYLKNRVALSTLTINLHEPQPLIGNSPGENPLAAAVRQAWRNFIGFLASLIASLGVLIPLALFGVIAWVIFKRVRRKRD